MNDPKLILNKKQLDITINRLCHQLIENHSNFSKTVIVGLQPRGIFLANRLKESLTKINSKININIGELDITFYRDDFRRRDDILIPKSTNLNISLEDKKVIIVDDVLYTGRSVRSALDALLDFGRPSSVELLVLINRRLSRDLPIQPNYVGHTIDVVAKERVKVQWGKNESVILTS